jgi:hypothetical protein
VFVNVSDGVAVTTSSTGHRQLQRTSDNPADFTSALAYSRFVIDSDTITGFFFRVPSQSSSGILGLTTHTGTSAQNLEFSVQLNTKGEVYRNERGVTEVNIFCGESANEDAKCVDSSNYLKNVHFFFRFLYPTLFSPFPHFHPSSSPPLAHLQLSSLVALVLCRVVVIIPLILRPPTIRSPCRRPLLLSLRPLLLSRRRRHLPSLYRFFIGSNWKLRQRDTHRHLSVE